MLRLLLTFMSVCSISSTNAFADKIQGKLFCKEVFPDGSSAEQIVTVTGSKMTIQDIEFSSLFLNKRRYASPLTRKKVIPFL